MYFSLDFYCDLVLSSNRPTKRKAVLAHKQLGRYVQALVHEYVSPESFEMLAFPHAPRFRSASEVAAEWRALLAVCPNVKNLTVFSLHLPAVLAELRRWPIHPHTIEGVISSDMLDFLAEQTECTEVTLMVDPQCLAKQPRPKPCRSLKKLIISDAWNEVSKVMLDHVTMPSAQTLLSLTIDINPRAMLDFSAFVNLEHLTLRLSCLRVLPLFDNPNEKRNNLHRALQLAFAGMPAGLDRLSLVCPTVRDGTLLEFSLFKHDEYLAALPAGLRRIDFSGNIRTEELHNLLHPSVHPNLRVLGMGPVGDETDSFETLADWCRLNGYRCEPYEPEAYLTLP